MENHGVFVGPMQSYIFSPTQSLFMCFEVLFYFFQENKLRKLSHKGRLETQVYLTTNFFFSVFQAENILCKNCKWSKSKRGSGYVWGLCIQPINHLTESQCISPQSHLYFSISGLLLLVEMEFSGHCRLKKIQKQNLGFFLAQSPQSCAMVSIEINQMQSTSEFIDCCVKNWSLMYLFKVKIYKIWLSKKDNQSL